MGYTMAQVGLAQVGFQGCAIYLACYSGIWVVVKIMVPFGVFSMIRHLVFRGPQRGP